jgi:hypothetical protein
VYGGVETPRDQFVAAERGRERCHV